MIDERKEDERREQERRERVEAAIRSFSTRKARRTRLADAATAATRSDLERER